MIESVAIAQTFDLTNCDKEPIHILGSSQPHGRFLVLQEPQLSILQVSKNTFDFIGIHPQELLNKLSDSLGAKQLNSIKRRLQDFDSINPLKIFIKKSKHLIFDGVIHPIQRLIDYWFDAVSLPKEGGS